MLAPLAAMLSPAGPEARLSVLFFHRVHPRPDPLFPDEMHAAVFAKLMRAVGRWFRVLPLEEAVARLATGALPSRALSISFDDGYRDNLEVALPILQSLSLPACFFITTGFGDGNLMWNDRVIEALRATPLDTLDLSDIGLGAHPLQDLRARRAAIDKLISAIKYRRSTARDAAVEAIVRRSMSRLPSDLMMRHDEVMMLHRAGMGIGAHTLTHPLLRAESPPTARQEIAGSKAALESLLQTPVTLFAYPNGAPGRDYLPLHAAMVQEAGFTAAFTTAPGAACAADDPMQLPRFSPWRKSCAGFGLGLLGNLISARKAAPTAHCTSHK